MPPPLSFTPAHEHHQALCTGTLTATALVEDALRRIEATDERIHAFLHVRADAARAAAGAADERYRAGAPRGPWDGIPIALKDNLNLLDTPTTCASRILDGYTAPYTATAVQQLIDAGAVIVGKTNLDEFAMGSSCEHSAHGPTRNPWAMDRVPGGSSGGSAAAVAAGQCVAALGSDTGGSIRQPAAFCGVVGVKPTYGRVSRFGLVAFGSSLDQIGPIARDVRDAASLLQVIAGHDPRDSTSVNRPVEELLSEADRGVAGLTIGIPKEFFGPGTDPQVEAAVRTALATLEAEGAQVRDVSLPGTAHVVAAYYVIAPAEASSNLARFDGVRYGRRVETGSDLLALYRRSRSEGFGPEVQRRIMIGTYALSAGYYDAYYKKAQQARALIKREYDAALEECDVLIGPTSPVPPFAIGERTDDPLQMYLADICTLGLNLAGNPGMSVPCGFTQDQLPVGMQIIGRPWAETTLFRVGAAFERLTEHRSRVPPLADEVAA